LVAELDNVYVSATDFEELIANNQDLSLPNPILGDKNLTHALNKSHHKLNMH
jgi:hypothetical protein